MQQHNQPIMKTHPLTGKPIAPVGFRKDGRAIWPIMGGDETAGAGNGAGGDGGQQQQGNAGQQGSEGGGKPENGKQPPWGKPENFDPDKAWDLIQNLRKENRTGELTQQLSDMQKAQDEQRDALAKALGVKPEETSDIDKLSQQLSTLSEQFTTAQQENQLLRVMASPGDDAEGNPYPAIPAEYQHLLTASEPEALKAQAKSVAELVALKAAGEGGETPGFQRSNGQGQGGGKAPALPQQIATAEAEVATKTPGSPEYKAAQAKVMQLKSQQLAALKP